MEDVVTKNIDTPSTRTRSSCAAGVPLRRVIMLHAQNTAHPAPSIVCTLWLHLPMQRPQDSPIRKAEQENVCRHHCHDWDADGTTNTESTARAAPRRDLDRRTETPDTCSQWHVTSEMHQVLAATAHSTASRWCGQVLLAARPPRSRLHDHYEGAVEVLTSTIAGQFVVGDQDLVCVCRHRNFGTDPDSWMHANGDGRCV